MTANTKVKLSTPLQSLTTIALTLPGIQNAYAETKILTPSTEFLYAFYDEGKNRYRVDNYRALLQTPLGSKADLSVNLARDVQAGASAALYGPASYYSANPADFSKIVPIVTEASIQEDRNGADATVRYFADEVTVAVTGNISEEHDFSSQGGSIRLIKDFNQKNTEVTLGYSFINNTVKPVRMESPWYPPRHGKGHNTAQLVSFTVEQTLTDKNYIQQILEFGYDHGYLSDPYKFCYVYGNPTSIVPPPVGNYYPIVSIPGDPTPGNGFGVVQDLRPSHKAVFITNTRFVQYIQTFNSSIHFAYRFGHNDWGINAHTFTIDYYQPFCENFEFYYGMRYYTQNSAKFYYIIFHNGISTPLLDTKQLHKHASTDYRLSKFGAISYQASISMRFLQKKNGKISLNAGIIDRRNRYYAGSQAKTPNPSNNFTTYFVGLNLSFEM